ncbi:MULTISPECIES: ABC transporter ATP-binding protein [unclassified Roseitalea]|uniref:ABC transporter ATP-binding protein n=1 Tax=unclassified Roseitalea TaxID=2639107 RepID=UPI00273E5091|nr:MULTISPECIES: ABC transporter ATP-binding protein [unclassified Roseitalea]
MADVQTPQPETGAPPPAGTLPTGEAILQVKGLNKRFGGLQAINNINLDVAKGSIHAIIGPNGAGKSTFLNCLIGLIEPDTGEILFEGKSIKGLKQHRIIQRGIARVFQTPQIFPGMSLTENVTIAALSKRDGEFRFNPVTPLNASNSATEEAQSVLAQVGLADQRDVEAEHLSRGDKRRLELAICIAAHAKLLLLDEPTAGMSRHDTNRTIDLLRLISEKGMTKIVIEHDMHVVFSLAQRVSVLAQGAVIADGTPEEVRGNPKVKEAYLGGAH